MKASTIIAFIIGSAVGVVCSWKIMETKYRNIADAEITSVKKEYAKYFTGCQDKEHAKLVSKYTHVSDESAIETTPHNKVDYTTYFPKMESKESSEPVTPVSPVEDVGSDTFALPYIIKPEAYGEYAEYTCREVTFNRNTFKLIDDFTGNNLAAEDIFGAEVFDHLDDPGIVNEDVIYVRDEIRQIDYEVTMEEE